MADTITANPEIETLLQQQHEINNQIADVMVAFNIMTKELEDQGKLGEYKI